MTADADISDFMYKKITDSVYNNLPPYQRRLSSVLSSRWLLAKSWELDDRWTEIYYDNGVWVGSDYFAPSAASQMRLNYYGINEKSYDNAIEVGLAKVKERLRIEAGCKVEYIPDYVYTDTVHSYQQQQNSLGCLIDPYVDITLNYPHVSLKGRIVRMINTQAVDPWYSGREWDLQITG